MGKYSQYNAAPVLERVEALIDKMIEQNIRRVKITDVYDELSIFDWWLEFLTKSKLYEMRQFLKEAIKLGYEGYVCFKVGATGCANGMWAALEESEDGHSPNGATLFRSFTPQYLYWDITDKTGDWDFEGKYKNEEDRRQNYDRLHTIKDLEAFIEAHRDQVYRK